MRRFGGDLENLDFNVKVQYELPSCGQSYQKNCPMFPDHLEDLQGHSVQVIKPERRVAKVTVRPQSFPISLCDQLICQCKVSLTVKDEGSLIVIAGEEDITKEGVLIATLQFENSGSDTAYSIRVDIGLEKNTVVKLSLAADDRGRCIPGSTECTIPFIEKGQTETLEVRVKSEQKLPTTMKEISATIKTETDCTSLPPPSKDLTVTVEQKWAIQAEAEQTLQQVNIFTIFTQPDRQVDNFGQS